MQNLHKLISDDLPWVDHVRLVVGPLASIDEVKSTLLAQGIVLPGWAAGSLSQLAQEILKENKILPSDCFSLKDQCDAIQKIAKTSFFKNQLPLLSHHLKDRKVSVKIATFLSALEKFYEQQSDLDVLIEFFSKKDPMLGTFLSIISELWNKGELKPWGAGEDLRRSLEILKAGNLKAIPRTVFLWGFQNFTLLEAQFLNELAQFYQLKFFVPIEAIEVLKTQKNIEIVPMLKPNPEIELWQPHSVWDEIAFLKEELSLLQKKGVPWNQIVLLLPKDFHYQQLILSKLKAWQVPIRTTKEEKGWKEDKDILWFVELLKVVSKKLDVEKVLNWIDPSPQKKELMECLLKEGFTKGFSNWRKLSKNNSSYTKEVQVLLSVTHLFKKRHTVQSFFDISKKLFQIILNYNHEKILGAKCFQEFAHQLSQERPFLQGENFRLAYFIELFEEYLENYFRSQKLSALQGLEIATQGVWLSRTFDYTFVLGANSLSTKTYSGDPWEWPEHYQDGNATRSTQYAWSQLHSETTVNEQKIENTFIKHSLLSHHKIFLSTPVYNLDGKPWGLGPLVKNLLECKPYTTQRKGAHASVGWVTQSMSLNVNSTKLLSPVFEEAQWHEMVLQNGIRISAFEDYLKCPFLFYARHVLKLEEVKTMELEPQPKTRGTILHNVLENFIRRDIKDNIVNYLSIERLQKILNQILEDKLTRESFHGSIYTPPLRSRFKASLEKQINQWLLFEIENRRAHPSLKPLEVERPVLIQLKLPSGETLKMTGRLDRVDSDGKNAVIVDYKSSTNHFIGKELLSGIGSQLLMYAQGVYESLHLNPAAAIYLALKPIPKISGGVFDKNFSKTLFSVSPRNSGFTEKPLLEILDGLQSSWQTHAQNLLEHQFDANPKRPKKDCPQCSFKNICGYKPTTLDDGEDEDV